MPFRLLTDFDGVWTDQADEARAVREGFLDEVEARLREGRPALEADFEAFLAAALAAPDENGWSPGGELTAFVDEDPILATASVAGWLDRGGAHPRADLWRAGLGCATELAHAAFGPATARHRAVGRHRLVPGARDVLAALRAQGVEVVIASNSLAARVADLLEDAGIDPARDVRLIGDARKWRLADGRHVMEVGERVIRVDRPHYRRLLEEVRPDLVVGDVLSLDLALPSMLRLVGVLAPSVVLVLRRHLHTPPWTLAAQHAGLYDRIIERVDELPRLVREARA